MIEYLEKKGIEVSGGYVSLEKSKLKKASESAVIKSPVAIVATEKEALVPPKVATGSIVELILTIKQLILDVGSKEDLKKLIDAL